MMPNVVHFTYHSKDDNMLVTCIHSFRKVCPDDIIVLTTDGLPNEVVEHLNDQYRVIFDWVAPRAMIPRRATCKIERLKALINRCSAGQIVLASDVDVVFFQNPFTAMEDQSIDLGLTTRAHDHLFPINGGIFFMRVNDRIRWWIKWHIEQIFRKTWQPYRDHWTKCKHQHYKLDWAVGQDFLVACWNERHQLQAEHGLGIVDVGPHYNFCPPTDTLGEKAFTIAWEAVDKRDVAVLHLKSALKKMIYDPDFPDAQLLYPKGTWAWL